MSDSNPDKLLAEYNIGIITYEEVLTGLLKWTSMIQASLHTQEICDILKVRKAIIIDTGKELDKNDFNKSL